MTRTLQPRLIPSALLALTVALCLQLLMQQLLSDPVAIGPTPAPAVSVDRFTRPASPETPPANPAPRPTSIKPPPVAGEGFAPPVVTPAPPSAPGPLVDPNAALPDFNLRGNLPELALPDQPARARSPVRPVFPAKARRAGARGAVLVRFTVDATGDVDRIVIESVQPRGYGFDAAVRRALRAARFVPATVDGQPVPTELRQHFVFELESL